jgi:hypothetical protein
VVKAKPISRDIAMSIIMATLMHTTVTITTSQMNVPTTMARGQHMLMRPV